MSIRTFFKSLTSTSTRRRPTRRSPPASRLCLEPLEDRCLLSFSPAVIYPVGASPQAVVTGDFNGDGRLDLAVANQSSNTVSILLGKGDGTFQPAQNFAAGPGPKSLAVGDFNGDGRLDLVTVNANGVSVLLGNGNGTFQAPREVGVPPTASPETLLSVAVGDLNGDGKLDLAVLGYTQVTVLTGTGFYGNYYTTYTDSYVSVMLGNGDASFTPKAANHVDSSLPYGMGLGDFNGDGKLDVAVATGGGLTTLLGNGDGTLQMPRPSGFTASPVGGGSIPVADFNRDGKLDLLMEDGTTNSLVVMLGNGDGTFRGTAPVFVGNIQSAVVGDVNADGKLDVVLPNSNYKDAYYTNWNSSARVLLGNGDGSFAQPAISQLGAPPPGNYFNSAVLGDFNGDGRPDLAGTATAVGAPGLVVVALNDGIWTATPQASSLSVSGFPSSTTAGVAGGFTLTARTSSGATATGYTGTIHFSSSDGQAGLPADYTFTAADAGVHTFSAILKTAGTQSITATDSANAGLTATQSGITVNSAAASTLAVAGFPSSTTAGVAGGFTVTLRDPYGNIASGYTGMVHFTSSDGKASLPANYTFTAADAGVHTFSATLKTAGTQSIAVTDTATVALSGSEGGITVNAAAASQFIISAPSSVTSGVAFSLTITVEDAYGNVVTGYTGTIHFKSTDGTASLPANYTFTAADKGVHTFSGLILRKKGNQTITITDTLNSSLTGSVIENVL